MFHYRPRILNLSQKPRAGYFSLVEVWIDGTVMIEVFDPKMIARYNETFTATTWKAMLRETPLAAQGHDVIEQLRGRSNTKP